MISPFFFKWGDATSIYFYERDASFNKGCELMIYWIKRRNDRLKPSTCLLQATIGVLRQSNCKTELNFWQTLLRMLVNIRTTMYQTSSQGHKQSSSRESRIKKLRIQLLTRSTWSEEKQRDLGRRRTGSLPRALSNWGEQGLRCVFITVSSVISWFIKIDLKHLLQLFAHPESKHGFLCFLWLFLRSTLVLNRNKRNW